MNNINPLLEKYWAGETDREEEQVIKAYFSAGDIEEEHRELAPLFHFFEQEKAMTFEGQPDLSFIEARKGRGFRLVPRIAAIAASLALLLAVSLNLFDSDTTYKNKYTELQDPEEALAITMEALEFLSVNYEKGAQPATRHFKKFEKTAVFNTNK